jgi:hypothetical protein
VVITSLICAHKSIRLFINGAWQFLLLLSFSSTFSKNCRKLGNDFHLGLNRNATVLLYSQRRALDCQSEGRSNRVLARFPLGGEKRFKVCHPAGMAKTTKKITREHRQRTTEWMLGQPLAFPERKTPADGSLLAGSIIESARGKLTSAAKPQTKPR